MAEERIYFARIAQAEEAIKAAGYQRNSEKHVWMNSAGRTARVVREEPGKFYVQWS